MSAANALPEFISSSQIVDYIENDSSLEGCAVLLDAVQLGRAALAAGLTLDNIESTIAEFNSLRAELATIFGPVKTHHGMTWTACMLARIGEKLTALESDVAKAKRYDETRAELCGVLIKALDLMVAPDTDLCSFDWSIYNRTEVEIQVVLAKHQAEIDAEAKSTPTKASQ